MRIKGYYLFKVRYVYLCDRPEQQYTNYSSVIARTGAEAEKIILSCAEANKYKNIDIYEVSLISAIDNVDPQLILEFFSS